MKKVLTTLAALTTLAGTAQADFFRVEMGGGVWNQKAPDSSYFQYEKSGVVSTFPGFSSESKATATDNAIGKEISTNYAWLFIKHPIPIIPNFRFEYSAVESDGILTATGELYGITANSAPAPTNMKLTQMEVIPYYNLLDNTFWLTLDLGLAIKAIHYHAKGGEGEVSYDESGDIALPLLYTRVRAQLPVTNLGAEAIVKYITDGGDNTVSDMSIKMDYTFDITPLVQPGLEIGYRVMTLQADNTDGDTRTTIDYEFSGVYGGLMLRF